LTDEESETSSRDVAQWILGLLDSRREITQVNVVSWVRQKFGTDFIYTNKNGVQALSKKVLREFRKLSGDNVVWENGAKQWRRRTPSDRPGRRQD